MLLANSWKSIQCFKFGGVEVPGSMILYGDKSNKLTQKQVNSEIILRIKR